MVHSLQRHVIQVITAHGQAHQEPCMISCGTLLRPARRETKQKNWQYVHVMRCIAELPSQMQLKNIILRRQGWQSYAVPPAAAA